MKFNSSEIKNNIEKIKDKIPEDINIEEIYKSINLPQLSDLSESFKKIIPKNLLQYAENGEMALMKLKDLKGKLEDSANNIKDIVAEKVTGSFDAIKNNLNIDDNTLKNITDTVSKFKKENESIINNAALKGLNYANVLNSESQDIASFHNITDKTIKEFSNLSPKNMRILQTNEKYANELKEATINVIINKTKLQAELMGQESLLNQQLDDSSYENLFAFSLNENENDISKDMVVERTVYWGNGSGMLLDNVTDTTSTGYKLMNDYSLAVDNSNILIGSKIIFSDEENKERECVDIALKSKGISKNTNFPVVAIYFNNEEEAMEYLQKYPEKTIKAKITYSSFERNNKVNSKKEKLEKIKNKILEEENKIKEIKQKLGIL